MRHKTHAILITISLYSVIFARQSLAQAPKNEGIQQYTCGDGRDIPVQVSINYDAGLMRIYGANWEVSGPYYYYRGPSFSYPDVMRYTVGRCALQYFVNEERYFIYCGIMGTCYPQ